MIKASDLRLGNKVMVNGKVCTVNNLFDNCIRVAEFPFLGVLPNVASSSLRVFPLYSPHLTYYLSQNKKL
jgi:hypothetical protein